jgi:AraC-like DNA-binding protein/mannose-6-phosphate isomerase-like protein (cupin superfamily)
MRKRNDILLDPIVYCDRPGFRVVDLRPDGISCIAAVGMSDLKKFQRIPELHRHHAVSEFCLCLKGDVIFEIGGREYDFLPGTMFAAPPDEPHRLKSNPNGLKLYRLVLNLPSEGRRILGLDAQESDWLRRAITGAANPVFMAVPRVKRAFESIFRLYDGLEPSPERRARMRMAALELLIAIVDSSHLKPSAGAKKIGEMVLRIKADPEQNYSVAKMAAESGLSKTAFAEAFKKNCGLPLHAYVIKSRILKAKSLLENTGKPVSDIAAEMRFSSAAHFITVFKKTTGSTPLSYRRLKTAT